MFLGSRTRPVLRADCLDNVRSLTYHNPIASTAGYGPAVNLNDFVAF
jgi:hypothetical protein